jgi:hypothetical protein
MVKTISSVIELILCICHLVCYEDNMYYVGFVTFKTRTSPVTPISSTNKTDRHDITEILLKLALNTISPMPLRP